MQVVYSSKFYITIVLGFSLDDRKTQEKLETMVTQRFPGGVKQVHYGLCENALHWWVEVLHITGFHVMSSNLRIKNYDF